MKPIKSHSKDESPEDHEMHEEQNLTETTSMIQNDEGFMNSQVQNDSLPTSEPTPNSTLIERESINQQPIKFRQKENVENPPSEATGIKNRKRNLRSEIDKSKSRHHKYAFIIIILSVII